MVLPNIILGENVVPEFLDDDANPRALADAAGPLLVDGPARRRQVDAFARLDTVMRLEGDESQAGAAPRGGGGEARRASAGSGAAIGV
jgi:lipid-A-disaccharide synthase